MQIINSFFFFFFLNTVILLILLQYFGAVPLPGENIKENTKNNNNNNNNLYKQQYHGMEIKQFQSRLYNLTVARLIFNS